MKPNETQMRRLIILAQRELGVDDDGIFGPETAEALAVTFSNESTPEFMITINNAWFYGPNVKHMPSDPSWYYAKLSTGTPKAIVAHYSSTDYGTAENMAKRRMNPITPADRTASWHISIEGDGSIIQQAPLTAGCWHAGGKTAKPIAGLGPANRVSVGIELIGYGKGFPNAQVASAKAVWRAIVRAYNIESKYAMIQHSELDPGRKSDPGPVWMKDHAYPVISYAYGLDS